LWGWEFENNLGGGMSLLKMIWEFLRDVFFWVMLVALLGGGIIFQFFWEKHQDNKRLQHFTQEGK